jgi:spore maturation protein CgeB
MIKAINSYNIMFNKNISIDINYRNFETMGCGTCLLTNINDQYEELGFKAGENYFCYDSVENAIEIINYLKENPQVVTTVAARGHEFVLNKHTFKKRAQSLIKYINTL